MNIKYSYLLSPKLVLILVGFSLELTTIEILNIITDMLQNHFYLPKWRWGDLLQGKKSEKDSFHLGLKVERCIFFFYSWLAS